MKDIASTILSTLISQNYPDDLIFHSQKSKNSPLEQP